MSQFGQNHCMQRQLFMSKHGIILSLLVALTLLISACSRPPDEKQIHEAITEMRDGIEQRQRKAVLKYLAADFKAQQSKSAKDINRLMLFYFRQNRNITVYLSNEAIKVVGTRAEVTLTALLTGAENLLPQRASSYAVQMRWNKLDGEWLLSRINWEFRPLLEN